MSTPSLWISGTTLSAQSSCVYDVKIEVSEDVNPTKLKYSGKPFSGSVPIWHVHYIGIAPASDLTSEVSKLVEEALKEFVNDRAEDIRNAAKVQ